MVRAIRAYRPLVVISRFSGTPNDGHGHHQLAGYLTPIAVARAADPGGVPGASRRRSPSVARAQGLRRRRLPSGDRRRTGAARRDRRGRSAPRTFVLRAGDGGAQPAPIAAPGHARAPRAEGQQSASALERRTVVAGGARRADVLGHRHVNRRHPRRSPALRRARSPRSSRAAQAAAAHALAAFQPLTPHTDACRRFSKVSRPSAGPDGRLAALGLDAGRPRRARLPTERQGRRLRRRGDPRRRRRRRSAGRRGNRRARRVAQRHGQDLLRLVGARAGRVRSCVARPKAGAWNPRRRRPLPRGAVDGEPRRPHDTRRRSA